MTVNAVAFYGLATVIVGGALGAVWFRSLSRSALALGVALLAVAVLEAISGARLLAVLQLIMIASAAALVIAVRRRGAGWTSPDPEARITRWWPVAAAVSGAFALLLVGTFAAHSGGWRHGGAPAALISVLHQREPLAVAIVVVLLVTALAGARVVGAVSDDERELEKRLEERRRRDERTRRRREDREAARSRRGPAAGGGAE